MANPLPIGSTDCKQQISLRERKFAKTKLALLQAALDRMKTKRLSDITVKELCEEVQVSEATFFNYFPKKEDLLHYFIKIWTLEVLFYARDAAGPEAGLSFVEHVFDFTGRELAEHPRPMLEIIAQMAVDPHRTGCEASRQALSLAERLQALPACGDVECLPELKLPELFRPPLERAVQRGELPASLDIETAVFGLLSIFFGVPLLLGCREPERMPTMYEQQLRLLWAGLRAA
jgi:AcrR family transcriptional regulator